MEQVFVKSEQHAYNIYITNSFKEFPKLVEDTFGKIRIAIVTDENVKKKHLSSLLYYIDKEFAPCCISLPSGERCKSFKSVKKIYKALMKNGFTRNDVVVAFGGGVIGDVAGFAASTYKRGIQLVQMPTTLLSQIDSSIGGKTSYNDFHRKNVIGTFYQPAFVYSNISVIKTLSYKEIKNAIAEYAIHCILTDRKGFYDFAKEPEQLYNPSREFLTDFVKWNCNVKATIVSNDTFDKDERKMLNFGHTIGHAIEATKKYRLKHGMCVSLGIMGAFRISHLLGLIDKKEVLKMEEALLSIGLPIEIKNISIEYLLSCINDDKKGERGKVKMILPMQGNGVKRVDLTVEELREKMRYVLSRYR